MEKGPSVWIMLDRPRCNGRGLNALIRRKGVAH